MLYQLSYFRMNQLSAMRVQSYSPTSIFEDGMRPLVGEENYQKAVTRSNRYDHTKEIAVQETQRPANCCQRLLLKADIRIGCQRQKRSADGVLLKMF